MARFDSARERGHGSIPLRARAASRLGRTELRRDVSVEPAPALFRAASPSRLGEGAPERGVTARRCRRDCSASLGRATPRAARGRAGFRRAYFFGLARSRLEHAIDVNEPRDRLGAAQRRRSCLLLRGSPSNPAIGLPSARSCSLAKPSGAADMDRDDLIRFGMRPRNRRPLLARNLG